MSNKSTKYKLQSTNMESGTHNLEGRTISFAKSILVFCSTLPKNSVTAPLVNQLIRSGTSIGANYQECIGASSKPDFINKITICRKEARETGYWLNLLLDFYPDNKNIISLKQESYELSLIFSKSIITSRSINKS